MHGRTLAIILSALALPAPGQTRGLLLSTASDASTATGRLPDIRDEDVLCIQPGLWPEVAPFFHRQNWEVLVGDANRNGVFDDAPGEVDALHVPPGVAGRPRITEVWLSFAADTSFPSGRRALDGDLVQLLPGGDFLVIVPEAAFEAWTGTTGVDIDGYARDAAGDEFFSFTDDETTVDAALIAQNGGSALLDKHTIFIRRAGAARAEIHYRKAQMVGFVGNALNRTLTTVVNINDVEIDPANPGHILFTTASTAAGIEGTVFTTAGGGQVAVLNGTPLSGTGVFGFATEQVLDGLALTDAFPGPASVWMDGESVTVPPPAPLRVRFLGGPWGGTAHILFSNARLPFPPPTALPPSFGGIATAYVDLFDPLLVWSAVLPLFRLPLDAQGDGELLFTGTHLSRGIKVVVQGVAVPGNIVTEPLILETF